jgi:uridine phosphorylase
MTKNSSKIDRFPITGLPAAGVSPRALVCGDPERARKISTLLDSAEELSRRREYHAYKGKYKGSLITVCSHGVGAPGAAIVFEEIIAAGVKTIIRVGTCGGLQPFIKDGDLVIATAAVQNTGYGLENMPSGYPASAQYEVVNAIVQAANQASHSTFTGLVLTRDVFYTSNAAPTHAPDYKQLSNARVLAVEMECATLFQIGNLHGVRTGAVLAVDGNVLNSSESFETYTPDRDIVYEAVENAIQIGLDSLLILG